MQLGGQSGNEVSHSTERDLFPLQRAHQQQKYRLAQRNLSMEMTSKDRVIFAKCMCNTATPSTNHTLLQISIFILIKYPTTERQQPENLAAVLLEWLGLRHARTKVRAAQPCPLNAPPPAQYPAGGRDAPASAR